MYLATQIIYFFSHETAPLWMNLFVPAAFALSAGLALWFRGIHRQVWRHTSLRDVVRVFQAVAIANLMSLPIIILAKTTSDFPLSAIYLEIPIWFALAM